MPTKVQKVKGKKVKVQTVFTDPLAPIKLKFQRLKTLRAELASLKQKYQEHDALMQELLPMFIEVQADKITVKREITLGSDKHRFTPFFYDEKKGLVVIKVWKSTAFEAGSIE